MNKAILIILFNLIFISIYGTTPGHVPTNGLQAWYDFDGNANNSFSASFHGTVNGPVATTDRFGNPNSAYQFDGVDDFIDLGTTILSGATHASLSCWVKMSRFSVVQNIWQKRRQSNGDGLYLAIYNSFLYAGLNREPSIAVTPSYTPFAAFNNPSWTHLVVNNNNGALTLYVNGVLFGQVSLPTGALVGNQSFYVGRGFDVAPDASGNRSFQGSIDDMGVWNRILTTQEISTLYNADGKRTYYTKASGSINQLSTWGRNADGTGISPSSFDSSNCNYYVVNNNTTLGGSFKIGGTNNVLVFGNGSGAFNFPIALTDTITCDSMFINTSTTLTVSGTLLNTKINSAASSTVQYIGSNPQTIAAGIYENMVTSASTKTLSGNVTVRGVLGMISSINCNNNELVLGTSPTTRGTLNRSSGTIVGRFSRWFANATNAGTTGLFPIGTSTKYTPIQIEFTTAPITGGKLTCEFITGAPGNTGLPQFDFSNGFVFVDKASIDGVVRYTSTGIAGGTFTATYTANNYVGVAVYSNLRLIHRNISGNWNLLGNSGTNTGTNSAAVISRTGLNSLSGELGIGGDQSENPLPVKLTNLSAKLLTNQSTLINWQTSFEYNSNKFIVQRSLDKNKWINRGEIKSKGNSTTTQNYSFIDDVNGLSIVIYYRLLQVDMDGTITTSKIVSVQPTKQTIVTLQVYPNPTSDKFRVTGLNNKAMLFDITGKQQLEILADGEINIAHLPAGMYFLRTDYEAIKIVKK